MTKQLMSRVLTESQQNEPLELEYYLLTTNGYTEIYGVLVQMHFRGAWESARFRYVTLSRRRIGELIETLSRGSVTPTTLDEVLQELL